MSLKSISGVLLGIAACTAGCNGKTVLGLLRGTGGAAGVVDAAGTGGAAGVVDAAGTGGAAAGGTGGQGPLVDASSLGGTAGTEDAGYPTGRACGGMLINAGTCPDGFLCVPFPNGLPAWGGSCQKVTGDGGQFVCGLWTDSLPCSNDVICSNYGGFCDSVTDTCKCLTPICNPGADQPCNDDPTDWVSLGTCTSIGTCVCRPGAVMTASGKCAGSLTCSYGNDAGAGLFPADGGSKFNSVCPAEGCPSGMVCVYEVVGDGGVGGEYCAVIPNECDGTPSCGCMASCACTNIVAGHPGLCFMSNGKIACDNRVR
jgi:hypothetical protein